MCRIMETPTGYTGKPLYHGRKFAYEASHSLRLIRRPNNVPAPAPLQIRVLGSRPKRLIHITTTNVYMVSARF